MAQHFFASMGPKEKVKEFNQNFTTILKMFQTNAKLAQELQIELYSNALPTSISIFVKRVTKPTLEENFDEEKIIEFKMKGCKDSHISLSKK
jgi:hypothetical protein